MPDSKPRGKMSVEKARQLRDLERGLDRSGLQDPHPGEMKQREIRFDHARPEQVEEARLLLAGLEGLSVDPGHHHDALTVHYDIREYTLQGLETALIRQGFHLDNSLVTQLSRAIVYFCEDTQLRNMRQPERLIKKSNEIYSKAWDQHLHGDHDDTPADLREER
ncbi:MAG: hypothetical protein M0P39_11780 [Rhodocyclaceae bacterium]|jgi:hypothetical protein|nr:hypothetical protein [Rhodocyclaceae bacterium]